MDIDYFVSYRFSNGFGRVRVTRDSPITCIEDVEAMEKFIKTHKEKENGGNEVHYPVIVGWQRFESPE